METKVWKVDKFVGNLYTYPQILEAAELLKQNELVVFPTETVYGLGANALNNEAVEKIYKAKGRPSDNPLIVHISDANQIETFVEHVPDKARQLMDVFWPGPLTIILKCKQGVLADKTTAGLSTVGVRMPDHPIALALIQASGLPIAAPSANLSGKPSPTTFAHVYNDLNGKVAGIIDGGPTGVGVESTVVDCTESTPVILRPGGITKEAMEQVIGPVEVDKQIKQQVEQPKSPGMKYKHYAPQAPMYLVEGSPEFLQQLINQYKAEGKKVAVLTTEERKHVYEADKIVSCGKRTDLSTVAQHLYDALRAFDEEDVDIILSETFPTTGIGLAIMNRLMKAAGHHLIYEEETEIEK